MNEVSYEFLISLMKANNKLNVRKLYHSVISHGITEDGYKDLKKEYLQTLEPSTTTEEPQRPQTIVDLERQFAAMGVKVKYLNKGKK